MKKTIKAYAVLDPKHGIQEIFLNEPARFMWEDSAFGKFCMAQWNQKIINIEIKEIK